MILDTSAYSALARGIQLVVDTVADAQNLILPLPVIAELRYGFAKGSQNERNELTLQRFLSQPQVSIALPTLKTTENYAYLQLLCSQRGRSLSQNDLWIAALVQENNEILITLDKDFTALSDVLLDKLIVL